MREEDVVIGDYVILTWSEQYRVVVVLEECETKNNRGDKLFYVSDEIYPFHPKYFLETTQDIRIFDIEI